MISESAKNGLNVIFSRAAKATLALQPGDAVEVETLPGAPLVDKPGSRILVLTVASYAFRLLVIFHLDDDPASADYFTRSGTGPAYDEVISELGNLCCGAMNRELGNYFVHTGMSTPYVLESRCLLFLRELNPGHIARQRIRIGAQASMYATLCVCAYAALDFQVTAESHAEVTGELEFF